MRRSAWLSASVEPVHRGFYEVRGPMIDDGLVLHWNGRYWGHSSQNPFGRGLHYVDHGFGSQKGDEWRGVKRR
jgi:hypothetical protein